MKKAKLTQRILGVALITQSILLIPFFAMLFTDEVNWSPGDFIVMGILLFTAGLAFVLITSSESRMVHRAAFSLTIGATLLMCWANLAVGLIGSGPNTANLMYIGVLVFEIIASIRVRFKVHAMERVMYFTAAAIGLVALIALVVNARGYTGSSIIEIVGVNTFFTALFVGSGLLFRHAANQQSPTCTT